MRIEELVTAGNCRYLEMMRHAAIYEDIAQKVGLALEDFDHPQNIGPGENELSIELSYEADEVCQVERWDYQFRPNSVEILGCRVSAKESIGPGPGA
ncbi:hypothetical protein [Marinobacter sp. MBR-105]|jgi:hypothetical protein